MGGLGGGDGCRGSDKHAVKWFDYEAAKDRTSYERESDKSTKSIWNF